VVGYAFPDPKTAVAIDGCISLVTADLFLRLIKMIIAPLVLSTLIINIILMGSCSGLACCARTRNDATKIF
jgi:Na+/H+-dicarboxylate symporter